MVSDMKHTILTTKISDKHTFGGVSMFCVDLFIHTKQSPIFGNIPQCLKPSEAIPHPVPCPISGFSSYNSATESVRQHIQ